MKECATEGCTKRSHARNLCSNCYQKERRKTDPEFRERVNKTQSDAYHAKHPNAKRLSEMQARTCKTEGCNKPHKAKGFCSKCYHNHRYRTEPEYRAKCQARAKASYHGPKNAQIRAKMAAQRTQWRRDNPEANRKQREREIAKVRERRRTDPEYREKHNAYRRERNAKAPIAYRKLRNILYLMEQQSGKCAICDEWLPEELSAVEVDHKVPVSKGGTNDLGNLQLVHMKCNRSKGAD